MASPSGNPSRTSRGYSPARRCTAVPTRRSRGRRMNDERPEQLEMRVLVLAPTARDAATSRDLLEAAGIRCFICNSIEDVCREAGRGAGAAVVTVEAVLGDKDGRVVEVLKAHPPWSQCPLVVLTPQGIESPKLLGALDAIGHMTLMKRP